MSRHETLISIEKEKLIVIVRLKNQDVIPPVIENLTAGGINVLEITSNSPGFLEEISRARREHSDALIGAGTITDSYLAQEAINAGAQFLVTPNISEQVMQLAHENDIPVIMGAFTPTEISAAINYGADIIKLFPADNLGVEYFKAIQGPFDKAKILPVGGIGLDNMNEWMKAGACGVGIGSTLVKADVQTPREIEKIRRMASEFVKKLTKEDG